MISILYLQTAITTSLHAVAKDPPSQRWVALHRHNSKWPGRVLSAMAWFRQLWNGAPRLHTKSCSGSYEAAYSYLNAIMGSTLVARRAGM